MALAVAYGLAVVGLALLIIYGADVAVGGGSGGDGFLPFDSMQRGIAFGTPPIILSIAAFVVSRKDRSMPLGGLIMATGILIIIGGIASISESSMSSAGGLLAVGAAIAALGAFKIYKSR